MKVSRLFVRPLHVLAAVVVSFTLSCLAQHPQADASHVLKGPYLQDLRHDGVTVMWEADSDAGASGDVVFTETGGGKSVSVAATPTSMKITAPTNAPNALQPIAPDHLVYAAKVDGLAPGKSYAYYVRFASGPGASGRFSTMVNPGRPFRFVVYGDTRSNPPVLRECSLAILKANPVFAVHTGDLIAMGSNYPWWEEEFFGPSKELLADVPVFPVLGNHEEKSHFFYDLFDLPTKEEYFWSIDCGDAHIAGIDTTQDFAPDSAQLKWLKEDLAKSKAAWKIVAFHVPVYTRGVEHWSDLNTRRILDPVLNECRVDVVFNGHNHFYERTVPIVRGLDENGKPLPKTGPDAPWAVTHIVAGSAGAPLYHVSPAWWTAAWKSRYHFCTVDVTPTRLTITAAGPEGKEFDKLVIDKKDGKPSPEYLKNAALSEEIWLDDAIRGAIARLRPARIDGNAPTEGTLTLTLDKVYPTPVKGTLTWDLDATGWKLEPASVDLDVPANGKQAFEFKFRVEPDRLYPAPRATFTTKTDVQENTDSAAVAGLRLARSMKVPFVKAAPVIDGKGNDAAWSGIEPQGLFVDPEGTRFVRRQTRVRACHDAKNVYFLIECDDPNPDGLVPKAAGGAVDAAEQDTMRVSVATAKLGKAYFRLLANCRGDVSSKPRGVKAATSVDKDRWSLELAIPFAAIPIPRDGETTWKANFDRRTAGGERSQWSLTWQSSQPARFFGDLVFEKAAD